MWQQEDDARAEQMLADAMVTFNARVIPPSTTPAQPGEVPAAATLGATGLLCHGSRQAECRPAEAEGGGRRVSGHATRGSPRAITTPRRWPRSGKHAEAIQTFDDVINRAGSGSLYGRMAQMGKADTQARAGQLNDAIAAWKSLASSTDEDLPKDAILMELGKAYQASGNQEEARKAFTQIVDEHPTSPYSAEARAELG